MFISHKVHYKINITGYKLRVFYADIVTQLDFLYQRHLQFLLITLFFNQSCLSQMSTNYILAMMLFQQLFKNSFDLLSAIHIMVKD
jgi:hypothetical protein